MKQSAYKPKVVNTWYMQCSVLPHFIMANDHGIQTQLNIDEEELESHTFKESSDQWLDYNSNIKKFLILRFWNFFVFQFENV